ncbi:HAD family hydrolase [Corynebacterium sp. HS2168-gen11]|uniref:HAD family hydrolase n=1 Tax=Corynebacterium sp. HS2168-gen11 TaxID=2974027 RepID=UPI00216B2F44|nr:HAD family hydrolase [Corynebacterium sp. HS2168-gen11]MCS4536455.1 haloacid dehalogenase-like hydrolase [Corynebacterium sp. HS2168-gen11]
MADSSADSQLQAAQTAPLTCALVYDFDGTLAKGNCAEHGLMPALGITDAQAFWEECNRRTKHDRADGILMYLGMLAEQAAAQNPGALLPEKLQEFGATIPFFQGVTSWFSRINAFAAEKGLELEHYVISSGLEEMIRGCAIHEHLTGVFGCKYGYYPQQHVQFWPTQAINYTTKTQMLFRINKGIRNHWDSTAINAFIEPNQRPMPFSRMIFLGDGDTDIPSMKLVKEQGGHSLAVYDLAKWSKASTQNKIEKLIAEERTNYVVPADYSEGSHLDITIKGLLTLIARKAMQG